MVREHAPLAIGSATEIEGDEMQLATPGRRDRGHWAEIERAAGDEGCGDHAAFDELTVAVDVLDDLFHQRRALDHAAFDACPFFGGDQQRDRAERPGALVRLADDAKSRPDVDRGALDAIARVAEIVARGGEFLEHFDPGGVARRRQHVAPEVARAIIVDPPPGVGGGIEQGCGAGRHWLQILSEGRITVHVSMLHGNRKGVRAGFRRRMVGADGLEPPTLSV